MDDQGNEQPAGPAEPAGAPGGVRPLPSPDANFILAVFDRSADASAAIDQLAAQGFPPEQISVVLPHRGDAERVSREAGERFSADEVDRATASAQVAGGITGVLGGLSNFLLPGFGPIWAAGPISSVIELALDRLEGVEAGSLAAVLVGLGAPRDEAVDLARTVHQGGALVTVQGEAVSLTQASAILSGAGAQRLQGPMARPRTS